jgi:uncharacterized protein YdeI (YjbR/CyaY-like superfamily)
MPKTDRRVDAYIAKSADFAKPILNHLRKLVHKGCPEAEETFKWSFPCFMYKGMLCSMAAFKEHCSFGFWKSELVLGKEAARSQEAMGQFGRITRLADLPRDTVILVYIKKAMQVNEAGLKLPRKVTPKADRVLDVPNDLVAALKANDKAKSTFEEFSYSHKKEYVEWLTEAKREETRKKRLETAIQWLAKGKSRNWKYANC